MPEVPEVPEKPKESETEPPAQQSRSQRRLELIAVIVLSATTILTAWSAFQSSKWGGAMSIEFNRASAQRIEAARLSGTANQREAVHVGIWTQWVAAEGSGNERQSQFLIERFPEPLAVANADWLAAGGAEGEVPSPFAMPSYVLSEREAAAAADEQADALFTEALRNNQRGDNYTLLTVLFAAVLFFTAMSSRVTQPRSQWALLALALVVGTVGVVLLVAFPKLV